MQKNLQILIAVLVILGLVGCQAGGNAASGGERIVVTDGAARARSITVSGSAEVKVVPDLVVLTLGVETWDTDLASAKAKSDGVVQRVQALAKELKVEAKDIQTDYYRIEPRYEDSYAQRRFLGYYTWKSLAVTLRDVTKFESLLSRAIEAGVTNVQGIDFQTSELRRYRDQARAAALQASREKAQAMAKELGQQAGDPLSIHEDSNSWYSGYSSWWGYARGSGAQNVSQNAGGGAQWQADSGVAPGQISVSATVTVEFSLIQP